MRNAYKILVAKPESNRPLGSQRRCWDDNIKTDHMKTVLKFVDWIHLVLDKNSWRALVYGNAPSGSIKDGELLE
jgi:hypothetical protein